MIACFSSASRLVDSPVVPSGTRPAQPASRYSFARRSTASSATEPSDANGVITVADRGPGFPAGHAERAFERFFSYRPGTDERREHMGLGLSIARAIVEGYGGSIRASNRPGGGATVEIRLPAVAGIQPSSRTTQIASRVESV